MSMYVYHNRLVSNHVPLRLTQKCALRKLYKYDIKKGPSVAVYFTKIKIQTTNLA